jgi:hypothetical protein
LANGKGICRMEILEAIEASVFAMWVKESSTAYVAVLAFHTIGLAFLVGISGITAMRILGVARDIPLEPMQDFFPLMFAGAALNVFTGGILMTLYPTNYLTEPTIYIKLAAIGVAIVIVRKLRSELFSGQTNVEELAQTKPMRVLAVALLVSWLVATLAGRVMAYTMPTKIQTALAVIVFMMFGFLVVYLAGRRIGLLKAVEA